MMDVGYRCCVTAVRAIYAVCSILYFDRMMQAHDDDDAAVKEIGASVVGITWRLRTRNSLSSSRDVNKLSALYVRGRANSPIYMQRRCADNSTEI